MGRFALHRIRLSALAFALAASSCGKHDKQEAPLTGVELFIERGNAPAGIDHVDLEVVGLNIDVTQTVPKPQGATELSLPISVRVVLPAGAMGQVTVTGFARGAMNNELGHGSVVGSITPGNVLTLQLNLGMSLPHDDAGTVTIPPAMLTIDPPSVDLGDVVLNHSSAPAMFTVKNEGGDVSGAINASISGDAATSYQLGAGGTCQGMTLAPNATCTLSVIFRPDHSGALRAGLEIGAMPGGTIVVILTGQGLGLGQLSLVPSMSNFGSVVVGQTHPPVDFSVKNTGESQTGSISVSLTGSGSYSITANACANQSLAASADCTVSVRYQPTVPGVDTATLAVGANPGGMQMASIFGRALAPAALAANPMAEDFGTLITGDRATVMVAISNTGGVPTTTLAASLSGTDANDFTITQDACAGRTLAPNASCNISIQIHPSAPGMKSATLMESGGASVTVNLTAMVLSPGALSVMPGTQSYTSTLIGTDGPTHTLTIHNTGGGATSTLSVSLTGSGASQFVIAADACANRSLAGGATCDISIRFHPTARNSQSASLLVQGTVGGAVSASLSGIGLAQAMLMGDATTTNFGTIDVTRSSPTFTWTITNLGDIASGPVHTTISGDNGDFAVMNHCTEGQALAGGANCTIVLAFAPTSGGSKAVTINVVSTPGGTVALSASGSGRAPQTLTVTPAGNGAGSVTSDVGNINCGTTCTADYLFNTMVTLTAAPANGSSFGGWGGACSGSGTCMVTMNQAQNVTATFTLNQFPLTVTGVPSGAMFTSVPSLVCAAGSCSGTFNFGSTVTLTGGNNAQYNFSSFSGANCPAGTTCTVTVNAPTTVAASYTLNNYPVTVNRPTGATLTIASNPALTCSGSSCTGSLPYGTTVMLTAANSAQYNFSSYAGGGGCGASPTCSFTVNAATTVTASYTTNRYALTVNGVPSGSSFTSNPMLTCVGATCSGTFDYGTSVVLTGGNNAQYNFASFAGSGCGAGTMCTVQLTGAATVNASYTTNNYTVTVTRPVGAALMISPALTCQGTTCSGSLPYGTQLMLSATNNPQYNFTTYAGSGCGASAMCTVNVTGTAAVTASYSLNSYVLTVTRPVGASFSSSPPLTCVGTSCTGTFTYGTQVMLTAANNPQYNFTNYVGGSCGASAMCTVTVNGTTNVTASYSSNSYVLTVTRPVGATLSSSPALTCVGTSCTGTFGFGTQVMLTAANDAQYNFTNYNGGGCGAAGMCTVTMNGTTNVTANYSLNSYALTVTRPVGASFSSSPPLTCVGTSCTGTFSYGTQVMLTAANDPQYNFTNYMGGGCGASAMCTVTVNATTNVTANYSSNSYVLTVTRPVGATFSSAPLLTCVGTSCTGTFAFGTQVMLTAGNDPQYNFTNYTGGGGCGAAGMCTVTMNGTTNVTANYSVNSYALTVTRPVGATFSSAPALTCVGTSCTGTFAYGTQVMLTAGNDPQYNFTNYTGGGGCGAAGMCTVTVNGTTNITANYSLNSYRLTVTRPVGATFSSAPALACAGTSCTGTFSYGTQVMLTAANDPQYNFANYTGGGGCGASPMCTVTMAGTTNVTANYNVNSYVLTVTRPVGATFSSAPALSCVGTSCTGTFSYGTQVMLTAANDAEYNFAGYMGGGCGAAGMCTVTMNGTTNVTASYNLNSYNFSIAFPGGASLSAVSNPALTCTMTSCSGRLPYGTSIQLTAANDAQYNFTGYSGGGGCGAAGMCTVILTGTTNLTANYSLNSYPVSLTWPSGASIMVSSNPALTCSNISCSGTLPFGTAVTITASNDAEYNFSSYSGVAACGANPTCNFAVGGTTNVRANYTLNQYTVTVTAGTGGSATANNLSCGMGCTFNYGDSVTIAGSPTTNWSFGFWSDTGGGPASRTFTVTGNFSSNASFSLNQVGILNSGVSFGGNLTFTGFAGSTSANPATPVTYNCSGTSGGPNCFLGWSFDIDTEVTVAATPDASDFLLDWNGGIGSNVGAPNTYPQSVVISHVGTASQGFNFPVPSFLCRTSGGLFVFSTWNFTSNCFRSDLSIPYGANADSLGADFNPVIGFR